MLASALTLNPATAILWSSGSGSAQRRRNQNLHGRVQRSKNARSQLNKLIEGY